MHPYGRQGRPTIVLEFQASRRLLRAWHAWCVLLAGALAAGLGWPWWARLAALLALGLVWRAGRDWLACPGAAVRRLVWDRAGRWWLQDPGRGLQPVRLAGLSVVLGPWMCLRFRGRGGHDLTVIDARYAEPVGLCRLKQALKLEFLRLQLEVRDARRTGC